MIVTAIVKKGLEGKRLITFMSFIPKYIKTEKIINSI